MAQQPFKALVKKIIADRASPEEIQQMEAWLDNRAEANLYDNLSGEKKEAIREAMLNRITSKLEPLQRPQNKQRTLHGNFWIKLAASVLLIASLSYVVWQYQGVFPSAQVVQESNLNGVKKVVLDDGTLVWLKGNSTITYPSTFSGEFREVSLQGEALFEVTKDKDHPFTILCDSLTTTVLGTSFNIAATDHEVQVVVLSGKVSLTSEVDKSNIILMPNETAVFNKINSKLIKLEEEEPEQVSLLTRGTEYDMAFDNARFEEVVKRLEDKFDVVVQLKGKDLGNCLVTVDLTDQSLDKSLKILKIVLSAEFKREGRHITFSGQGCKTIK